MQSKDKCETHPVAAVKIEKSIKNISSFPLSFSGPALILSFCQRNMNWDQLPNDIISLIFWLRRNIMVRKKAALMLASRWKTYRTRILFGRFKMLRYLQEFRTYNPSIQQFLARARL